MTDQHSSGHSLHRELSSETTEFVELVAEMVADQAPRVFAIVHVYGEGDGAEIAAWGFELDDGAYVVADGGRSQFILAEVENALKFFPSRPGATPHLVWADRPSSTIGAGYGQDQP